MRASLTFVAILVLTLFAVSCGQPTSPGVRTSIPSVGLSVTTLLVDGRTLTALGNSGVSRSVASFGFADVGSRADVLGANGEGVSMCHATGAGKYVLIDVSVAAESAHRAHGDAAVGEPVPGQPGHVFDANCTSVVSGPSLVCGFPVGGSGVPGSSVPPGPSVFGEVQINYDVTVTPAPPDGTLIQQDNLLNGVNTGTLLEPLTGGYFAQFTHGIAASISGVFEVRFIMQGSSCSLFWNVNPGP